MYRSTKKYEFWYQGTRGAETQKYSRAREWVIFTYYATLQRCYKNRNWNYGISEIKKQIFGYIRSDIVGVSACFLLFRKNGFRDNIYLKYAYPVLQTSLWVWWVVKTTIQYIISSIHITFTAAFIVYCKKCSLVVMSTPSLTPTNVTSIISCHTGYKIKVTYLRILNVMHATVHYDPYLFTIIINCLSDYNSI